MNRKVDWPVQGHAPHFVVILGILVGILPAVFLPQGAGPLAFVVLVMKIGASVIGLSITAIGVQCYRTKNTRLAVVTGLTIIGWIVLGAVARFHNESNMSLVPVWVWWLAVILVFGLAYQLTSRIVNGGR